MQILLAQEINEEKCKQLLVEKVLLNDMVLENHLGSDFSEKLLQYHLVYDKKTQQKHDSLFVLCVEIFLIMDTMLLIQNLLLMRGIGSSKKSQLNTLMFEIISTMRYNLSEAQID